MMDRDFMYDVLYAYVEQHFYEEQTLVRRYRYGEVLSVFSHILSCFAPKAAKQPKEIPLRFRGYAGPLEDPDDTLFLEFVEMHERIEEEEKRAEELQAELTRQLREQAHMFHVEIFTGGNSLPSYRENYWVSEDKLFPALVHFVHGFRAAVHAGRQSFDMLASLPYSFGYADRTFLDESLDSNLIVIKEV